MIRKIFLNFNGLLVAGLLSTTAIQFVHAEILLKADKQTFIEKYDKTVDVADQLRAGLMYGSTLAKVDLGSLRVHFQLHHVSREDKICIRVASRDGVFSANWEVPVTQEIMTYGLLEFQSAYRLAIENYETNELVAVAAAVKKGQKCTVQSRHFLPSSWGTPDLRTLTAYLNADSSEVVIARRLRDSPIHKESCKVLSATDSNIAFDTVCTLPMDEKDSCNSIVGTEFL